MEFKDLFKIPQFPDEYYCDIELRFVPAIKRTAQENRLGPDATQTLGTYCMGLWYQEISRDLDEPVSNATLKELDTEIRS